MRKYHQKLIFEIMKTLWEAVDEVSRLLSQSDFQSTINLLADCQAGAIQIGEFIESKEGKGTKTVSYLEELCDLLYNIGITITENKGAVKTLRRQLTKIESSILRELKPNKIEIAFFPYKADMWDSMESVWNMAMDDDHCEPYVIPIPYFDKLPDGSLGPMHYEASEYPKNIQITHWQEYNTEERHPDVVIIHNPYDNENRVTTVHPDYYSKKLKGYTDLLCYIPYFVSQETLTENFCTAPGVRRADRVFVQSEEVRDFYIRVLRDLGKKHNCAGIFGNLEEKIVASGSPKFDKVFDSKPENYTLPDEWRKLIENPDGSLKKIVLYCTSIGSLLRGEDEYLKKLDYVIKSLSKREDIVLWWRPHPLQEATYKAMRPQLFSDYQKIIAEYQKSESGIYDDTSDLYRALFYGSVYYGDWSSLVLLFGVMGKRIMLQELFVPEKNKSLCFGSVSFDQSGNAWGWDMFFNGFFSLDFQENKARLMGKDDSLPGNKAFSHIPIDVHQDKVISFPTYSESIVEYDILQKTKYVTKLNLEYRNIESSINGFNITHWVKHNEVYYCFGRSAEAIVVYDSKTRDVYYHTDLFKRFASAEDGTHAKCPIYIGDPTGDGWVILLLEECDSLIRYCLVTQEVETLISKPEIGICSNAEFDGERFWLVSQKREMIFSWNPVTGEFVTYSIFPEGFLWSKIPGAVLYPMDCGGNVLFFPSYENMVLCLDKNTGQISEYGKIPVPHDLDCTIYKYQAPRRIGNNIYAFARFNQTVYELDINTDKVTAHSFILEEDDISKFIDISTYYPNGFLGNNWREYIIKENVYADELFRKFDFENDIERSTAQKNMFLSLMANPNGEAGKAILNEIKAQIDL